MKVRVSTAFFHQYSMKPKVLWVFQDYKRELKNQTINKAARAMP